MKRELIMLLTCTDSAALTSLARAIKRAERRDHVPVWRLFVLALSR